VHVAISVEEPRFTLADLTIGFVGWHGVQVHGELGASEPTLHNVRVVDTGQQLVKGSTGEGGRVADRGLVACSTFEYSEHAPSDYTNGVDVHKAADWVIRDCVFRRIRGPREGQWRAGPAILFWNESSGTVVERNTLIDCYRGIALGIQRRDGGRTDHRGGVIRHNMICNLHPWADEAIEATACPDVVVERNTVLVEGRIPWAIGLRYPETTGLARRNLTNRPVLLRDGANATLDANVADARRDWFVDPARGDLRLTPGAKKRAPDVGALIPTTGGSRPGRGR
jgi:hypothetical protein